MRRRSKQARKGHASAATSKLDTWAPKASQLPRMLSGLQAETRIIRRSLANVGVLSTNASGVIGVQAIANSTQVNTCPAWSNLIQSALEYRVLGIEVDFFPIVNCQAGVTTPAPCFIATCGYSSGTAPATIALVCEGPGAKLHDGFKRFRAVQTARGFPDAMLWTSNAGTIPALNGFGIMAADQSLVPAGAISQIYFRYVVKYLLELRSLI